MAYTEQETIVANPAHKSRRKRSNAGKRKGRMTLKQKLHFGSKRQRAAAKKALSRRRKKSHAKAHRARTNLSVRKSKKGIKGRKYELGSEHFLRRHKRGKLRFKSNRAKAKRNRGGLRRMASEYKRHRAAGEGRLRSLKRAHKTVKHNKPKRARKRNPGEIISIFGVPAGNPARKGKRKMAATKRKRRHSSSHHRRNAGTRHHQKTKMSHRRHHRRNPGMTGIIAEAIATGVGLFGSQFIAQTVLGSGNTGIMGYVANGIAGGLLAGAASMVRATKHLAPYIVVGTALEIIYRIIVDNSLLGQYSSQLGMGDYMASNWVTPQRLPNALHNAQVQIPAGWGGAAPAVMQSAAAPAGAAGMGWAGGEHSYY